MPWTNSDGLTVKFGIEEAALARGGDLPAETDHVLEVNVLWTDALSASSAVVGGTSNNGTLIPRGAVVRQIETFVVTPFTSSGTVASSTLVLGTHGADDGLVIDADDFTTIAFVGTYFDGAGEGQIIKPGVTGAGDIYGVQLAENALLCASNSAHASHPFTGGELRVRIIYTFTENEEDL